MKRFTKITCALVASLFLGVNLTSGYCFAEEASVVHQKTHDSETSKKSVGSSNLDKNLTSQKVAGSWVIPLCILGLGVLASVQEFRSARHEEELLRRQYEERRRCQPQQADVAALRDEWKSWKQCFNNASHETNWEETYQRILNINSQITNADVDSVVSNSVNDINGMISKCQTYKQRFASECQQQLDSIRVILGQIKQKKNRAGQ